MEKENIIVKFSKENLTIEDFYNLKLLLYGDRLEVRGSLYKNNHISTYKKISKDIYVNKDTGEVKTANHTTDRSQSYFQFKKSAKKLSQLIICNFYKKSGLHIVLTYAEKENNPDNIYKDFKPFWQKLKYRYSNLMYISVLEPHKKGGFHIHMLVRDLSNPHLFISKYIIRDLWKKGACYVAKLKDTDYGLYFSKKITKNSELLSYYPAGTKFFRHSRNIKYPYEKYVTSSFADRIIQKGNYQLSNTYNLSIVSETEKLLNQYFYAFYKKTEE